jgi:hypothetical protein
MPCAPEMQLRPADYAGFVPARKYLSLMDTLWHPKRS